MKYETRPPGYGHPYQCLSASQMRQCDKMHEAGKSIKAIAEYWGIEQASVRRVLRRPRGVAEQRAEIDAFAAQFAD